MAKVTEGTSGSDGVVIIADSTTEPVLEVRLATDAHNRLEILGDGSIKTGAGGSAPAAQSPEPYALTTGHESLPRTLTSGSPQPATGSLRFTYFTARRAEPATQVRVWTGTTAAAATPTLVRFGLYMVEPNQDLTLVASTANDTTLLAAPSTSYTKALQASYTFQPGVRYAFGPLVVSGTTMPNYPGLSLSVNAAEQAVAPRLTGALSGQTDLPATVAAGSIAISGFMIYGVFLP